MRPWMGWVWWGGGCISGCIGGAASPHILQGDRVQPTNVPTKVSTNMPNAPSNESTNMPSASAWAWWWVLGGVQSAYSHSYFRRGQNLTKTYVLLLLNSSRVHLYRIGQKMLSERFLE